MIFQEGRNCWKISRAKQLAFLVDGKAYFEAFTDSILRARNRIHILGWDFHTKTRLTDDWTLESLLRHKCLEVPDIKIRILNWNNSFIYSHERQNRDELLTAFNDSDRMRFLFDSHHPLTASQHQKVVIIDDQIAFSGGLDLTQRRWDTPQHLAEDIRRRDPEGSLYGPFHDVQALLSGDAVRTFFDLFQYRWKRRTGETLEPAPFLTHAVWPSGVNTNLRDVDVAISRTLPKYDEQPSVRENERLYLDMIEEARDYIYIETQYFTNHAIADALAARLQDNRGPEVLICIPQKNSGWIEESTMGTIRFRILRDLRESDRFDRLAVFFPAVVKPKFEPINLHSKIFIVDDRFCRVGSANLSNRSMGMDSECDVSIDRPNSPEIRRFRDLLLSEHLGYELNEFAQLADYGHSLISTVAGALPNQKALVPFPEEGRRALDIFLPRSTLIDPTEPYSLTNWGRLKLDRSFLPSRRQSLYFLVLAMGILLMTYVWTLSPLKAWADPQSLALQFERLGPEPFRSLYMIGLFFILCTLLFPLNALLFAIAFVFPVKETIFYCMVGALLSGSFLFVLGRRGFPSFLEPQRVKDLQRKLKGKGSYVVFLVRLMPLLPYSAMNFVMGSSGIGFADFLIGTFFGLLPGVLSIALFEERLRAVFLEPNGFTVGLLAGLVLIFFMVQKLLVRLIQKRVEP